MKILLEVCHCSFYGNFLGKPLTKLSGHAHRSKIGVELEEVNGVNVHILGILDYLSRNSI